MKIETIEVMHAEYSDQLAETTRQLEYHRQMTRTLENQMTELRNIVGGLTRALHGISALSTIEASEVRQ